VLDDSREISSVNDPPVLDGLAPALPRVFGRTLGVLGFALLTWAAARISVPLPFTPIPGTLQVLAVLLAGAMLGPRAGAASQAAYLMAGLAGLPVFALPGAGPGYLLGPTGGYLLGFVAAAYVTGEANSRLHRFGLPGTAIAFLAGDLIIHICGWAWLSVFMGDAGAALRAGLLPFALFDLAKIVVATGIYAGYSRWKVRILS